MTLSALSVGSLTLSPSFSPDVTSYTVNWPDDKASRVVNATANDSSDDVLIYAEWEDEGAIDIEDEPPRTYGSDFAPTNVHIRVVRGNEQKTYTVHNTYYD